MRGTSGTLHIGSPFFLTLYEGLESRFQAVSSRALFFCISHVLGFHMHKTHKARVMVAGTVGKGSRVPGDLQDLLLSHFLSYSSPRRVYKERLGLSMKIVIGYQAHADTATKSNSLAKNKFVV